MIQPARWTGGPQGEILSTDYGDAYANRSGAWGQAAQVFIQGCALPERWAQLRCVRVLETGFGLGVNFLATWAAQHQARRTGGAAVRLSYLAIEKHPFTRSDLRAALEMALTSAPADQA